ncbi:MAG: hypothetical protein I8H75_03280 [Myxococcaceae bacterium]|nr:hypothetical protein [Myxococcaceae bacterium]MBH2006353.1 hypothetical protein [Myxococcaceae bacterium]
MPDPIESIYPPIERTEEILLETPSRFELSKQALQQKLRDVFKNPKEAGVEAVHRSAEIAQDHGATFLHHIPFLGGFFALFAKRRVQQDQAETLRQFQVFDRVRLQSLSTSKQSIVNLKRGIDPIQYSENLGIESKDLLANSCEYAQLQFQKRIKKLNMKAFATDLQIIGASATTSVVAAPAGLGFSFMGSIMKGFSALKSLGTFIQKVWLRTLGIERTRHAQILFGLALLKFKDRWPEALALLPTVQGSIETLQNCGIHLDSQQDGVTKALDLIKNIGVRVPDSDATNAEIIEFAQSSLLKIKNILRS